MNDSLKTYYVTIAENWAAREEVILYVGEDYEAAAKAATEIDSYEWVTFETETFIQSWRGGEEIWRKKIREANYSNE